MSKKYETILFHPYYSDIKKKCLADEPGTKIANWVNNTVDSDPEISEDKKREYHVNSKKVNMYKDLLKEQTKDILVKMDGKVPIPTTAPMTQKVAAEVEPNEQKVYAPMIVKDVENRTLDVGETFLNIFTEVQNLVIDLRQKSNEFQNMDTGLVRTIFRGLAEMRQMFELYCRMTGREEFAKAVGTAAGQRAAENKLSETTKHKIKEWARDILADVNPNAIPKKIAELEEILSDT